VEFLRGGIIDMNRHDTEALARPIVGGLVILVTLLLLIGAAIRDPTPHDVPVGLVGPAQAIEPLAQGFGQNAPGAFAFTTYDSEAAARSAIDHREVVGALVVGQAGPTLVVASAAGEAIAGGVTAAFTQAFAAQGVTLTVEQVHAFPSGDAHGIVLFFLVLATLAASVLAGAAAGLGAGSGRWTRTTTVLATFAILAGIVGPATAAWLVGGYGDGIWGLMGIAAVLAFAVSTVIAGAARWLGAAGVGLTALVVVLLGLVSSGGPLGSQLLPDAYRLVAPWLPVLPAYDAMRGALAFGGAGVLMPALVLVAWAAVGVVALALPRPAGRAASAQPAAITA
jgi:hypothetical protein